MPVYILYRCDFDNLASQEPGGPLFVAKDALGRDWLCIETTLESIPEEPFHKIGELVRANQRARQMGLRAGGRYQLMLDCPDRATMQRELVLSTYPEKQESAARLAKAGWDFVSETWYEGSEQHLPRSILLVLTKSGKYVRTAGATQAEAWAAAVHAAARQESSEDEANKPLNPVTALPTRTISVPLRTDDASGVRVGDSRVSLDVVISEFKRGADPESIAHDYPTLQLADVYAVITYYLYNLEEVESYFLLRQAEAEELQQKIEAKQGSQAGLREKLLDRKAKKEQEHASPDK